MNILNKLPDNFYMGAHKIRVLCDPKKDKYLDKNSCIGEYHPQSGEMYVHTELSASSQKTRRLQVLLHEVVHCILLHYGEPELNDNEELVDKIAEGFCQFLLTAK